MPIVKPKLLVIGVHKKVEAYPNTLYRLEDLKQLNEIEVSEINFPLSADNLYKARNTFQKSLSGLRGILAHCIVMMRYVFSAKADVVYVPYPAVFVVFLLSWLPGKLRPKRIVIDAFISIYDTIVNDRKLLKDESVLARILYHIEKKAYCFSTRIIVDTPQNLHFLSSTFSLDQSKLVPIPLSTDENHFLHAKYDVKPGICRVLFVGTLVPLHGIQTVLDAAAILSYRRDIVFKVIGDGQEAGKIEHWKLSNATTLQWERNWLSSASLAKEIEQADICLGIFGAGNKTQRVCPFKIYAYSCIGRPIITGKTDWANLLFAQTGEKFFEAVPVEDAEKLVSLILKLADDASLRESLALASRKLYIQHLSNSIASDKLLSCLLSLQ
jgi:glycosyltransferase involved in cell wall biosynthesis